MHIHKGDVTGRVIPSNKPVTKALPSPIDILRRINLQSNASMAAQETMQTDSTSNARQPKK